MWKCWKPPRLPQVNTFSLYGLGEPYAAVAVCKDTVTMLCQIPEEQIVRKDMVQEMKFRELLSGVLRREQVPQHEEDALRKPEGEQTDGFDQEQ